tara:strand:+ start:741 stop:899 length:159 start_codon:yes stop_codon:yes gene_type:complete
VAELNSQPCLRQLENQSKQSLGEMTKSYFLTHKSADEFLPTLGDLAQKNWKD